MKRGTNIFNSKKGMKCLKFLYVSAIVTSKNDLLNNATIVFGMVPSQPKADLSKQHTLELRDPGAELYYFLNSILPAELSSESRVCVGGEPFDEFRSRTSRQLFQVSHLPLSSS
jgi:hypothetical protein